MRECLLVVLNEEWEHRLYAERDLDALQARSQPVVSVDGEAVSSRTAVTVSRSPDGRRGADFAGFGRGVL